MKSKTITAAEFDQIFDEGGDVSDYLDYDTACRPNLDIRRVNVDMPEWMIDRLDGEARRIGITRQAVIKVWLAERLDAMG